MEYGSQPGVSEQRQEVTRLLAAHHEGDRDAFDELVPMVYAELRRIAHGQLNRGRPDRDLDTTALVHEAYFKLVDESRVDWQSRSHFFAIAARTMRRIIVDFARKKNAAKRGGGESAVEFDPNRIGIERQAEMLIALDGALSGLTEVDPRLTEVVEYRFFGGMTVEEIAQALDVSSRTIERDWKRAKAWLMVELT